MADEMTAQVWLTAHEAADRLRLSIQAFYKRVDRGQIPYHRLGRSLRFKVEDIDAAVTPESSKP